MARHYFTYSFPKNSISISFTSIEVQFLCLTDSAWEETFSVYRHILALGGATAMAYIRINKDYFGNTRGLKYIVNTEVTDTDDV